MKLKFLGRGSAFNTKEGNTSAYFEMDNNLFLIDCGESVFHTLISNDILKNYKDIYVFITHLHSDHIGSLSSLIFYCWYILNKKIIVIYDNKDIEKLENILALQGVENILWAPWDTRRLNKEFKYKLHVEIIEESHTDNNSAFGYFISDFNGNNFYYTGDTNGVNTNYLKCLKGDNIIIYHDCCMKDYENNPHTSLKALCNLIPKEKRNRVYIMHIDCDELIDEAKEKRI